VNDKSCRKTANIIVKKLSSLQHFFKDDIRQLTYKTANITKDDITSQHSDILAICCKVISSFVIFAVLDLQVGGCRP